jgi:hypothetical protein
MQQTSKSAPRAAKNDYVKRASRRFLAGTGCSTPERAVARGVRSIDEWTDILVEELERQAQMPRKGVPKVRQANGRFGRKNFFEPSSVSSLA